MSVLERGSISHYSWPRSGGIFRAHGCVKVQVLSCCNGLSVIVLMGSVDVKQHWTWRQASVCLWSKSRHICPHKGMQLSTCLSSQGEANLRMSVITRGKANLRNQSSQGEANLSISVLTRGSKSPHVCPPKGKQICVAKGKQLSEWLSSQGDTVNRSMCRLSEGVLLMM